MESNGSPVILIEEELIDSPQKDVKEYQSSYNRIKSDLK